MFLCTVWPIASSYVFVESLLFPYKLKMIEEAWVENGFTISEKNIQKIAKG